MFSILYMYNNIRSMRSSKVRRETVKDGKMAKSIKLSSPFLNVDSGKISRIESFGGMLKLNNTFFKINETNAIFFLQQIF